MTKAEEFDKARRLAYKGDFSLVEKLYDPDCKHFDHRAGMEVNLDTQNAIMQLMKTVFLDHSALSMKTKNFYVYIAMLNGHSSLKLILIRMHLKVMDLVFSKIWLQKNQYIGQ